MAAADPASTVLVVLAAGAGQRLGGVAKALLTLDGEPYLARICATARAAGVSRGVAVVGPPHGAAVAEVARALGLEVAWNPEPERGMASSIELGFAWAAAVEDAGATAAAPGALAALLWPCDHPSVSSATVLALRAAFAAAAKGDDGPPSAVIPTVDGRGGHPALIARALFAPLTRCAAQPQGARSVLRAAKTLRLPVDDRGVIADVDVPADLAQLAARQEVA